MPSAKGSLQTAVFVFGIAGILAGIFWVLLSSPWWLGLPVGAALITYSFSRDAHVRWALHVYRDADGNVQWRHYHNELNFRILGMWLVLRILVQVLRRILEGGAMK